MKKLIYSLIMMCILSSVAYSKEDKMQSFQMPLYYDLLLNNSNLGKEFWVALPQNETITAVSVGLEIVVVPIKNTQITLEIPFLNRTITKNAKALEPTTFSLSANELVFSLEVTEAEQAINKGINLKGDEPFACVLLTAKRNSGEGFLAYPVDKWGTEYYHTSFYDFKESASWGVPAGARAGGFLVVASEDNTNITVKINGVGSNAGSTSTGKRIGETISATLNQGEVYMVKGNANSLGEFDISGSKVTSNKPVGLISFHNRTMIPSLAGNDRNFLAEMLPPTNFWGKNYVTVQFDRVPSGNKQGVGDLFRGIASNANTEVKCEFYSTSDGNLIGNRSRNLVNPGDFFEIDDIRNIPNSNNQVSVRGASIWTSNKKFMLNQYAFSFTWDNDTRWSPLQIIIPPVEQFVRSIVFVTPETISFNENTLTLFVMGDPNDTENKKVKALKRNGVEVWRDYPRLLTNKIPNTDIYWIRMPVSKGAHYITSESKVSGYLKGQSSYNAYGYPIIHGTNVIDRYDNLEPEIVYTTDNCGNFFVEALENRKSQPGEQDYEDQGVAKVVLFEEFSNNFQMMIDNPQQLKFTNWIKRQKFDLKIIDNTKQAKAIFAVMDRAGNVAIDSVEYIPENLAFANNNINFGKTRVGKTITNTYEFENKGGMQATITELRLKYNTKFDFAEYELPIPLLPGEKLEIVVNYAPDTASVTTNDIDTLIIKTNCVTYTAAMVGGATIPNIAVQGFDFGIVKRYEKVCMGENEEDGIRIQNTGTDTLTVISIEKIQSPFVFQAPHIPSLPLQLEPGKVVYYKSICFIPQDSGLFESVIEIHSDAANGNIQTVKIQGTGKVDTVISVFENFENIADLNVIPNPADGASIQISFELLDFSNVIIEIYDEAGNLVSNVFSGKLNKGIHRFDSGIKQLSSGNYFIRFSNGYGAKTKKLIINR